MTLFALQNWWKEAFWKKIRIIKKVRWLLCDHIRRPGVAVGAGGLGVSLRVTVTACARGHALPTCPPARQHHPHRLPPTGTSSTPSVKYRASLSAPLLTLLHRELRHTVCFLLEIFHISLLFMPAHYLWGVNQIFKLPCGSHSGTGLLLLYTFCAFRYAVELQKNLPPVGLCDRVQPLLSFRFLLLKPQFFTVFTKPQSQHFYRY